MIREPKVPGQNTNIGQDLSVFRVKDTTSYGSSLKLRQIDVVFGMCNRFHLREVSNTDCFILGATVGSVQLDILFEKAVLDRLELANRIIPMGLEDLQQTAWEMRICKEYQYAIPTLIALPQSSNELTSRLKECKM